MCESVNDQFTWYGKPWKCKIVWFTLYMPKFTLRFCQSFLLQTLIYYGRMNEWPMNTIHMHILQVFFFFSPWVSMIQNNYYGSKVIQQRKKNAKGQMVTWRKREWVRMKRMLRDGIYGGMTNLAKSFHCELCHVVLLV